MKLPSLHNPVLAALVGGALAAALLSHAAAEDLPTYTGEKAVITGGITPAGDVDAFRIDLFVGETVSVKAKDAGPARGLLSTLRLRDPDGDVIPITISKQGTRRPSFSYEATESGSYSVELSGDPGGFGGAEGNYTLTTAIKRSKSGKSVLDAPGGGMFAIPLQVSDGALVDVKLSTKKGGFDVEGLFRPDDLAEGGFVDSLKKKDRRSAKAKKFAVSGGFGTYELRGSYDAGSSVKVSLKVRHAAGTRKARLSDAEPKFDPWIAPFPSTGVTGTLITLLGQNLVVGSGSARSDYSETFEGGDFTFRFPAVDGSLLDVSLTSKNGGFDVTGLIGPDGRIENAFLGSLNLEGRTSATSIPLAPFRSSRGPGYYELHGTADAGATVTAKLTVIRGDGRDPDRLPRVWMGTVEIDPIVLDNASDQALRFRVPAGLQADKMYDLTVRNADGQGAVYRDAFYFVPEPRVTSLTATQAGPAGGRNLRILGFDFRPDVIVLFDGVVVQPSFAISGRIDVTAPPHAPGAVFPIVRDGYGQTATSPVALTYLDIGSNAITDVQPSALQGIGGETVTVSGMDFGVGSVLYLDGRPLDAQLVSAMEMTFVAPPHDSGTFELSVIDDYEQTSTTEIEIVAFTDESETSIPAPLTDEGAIDGWRASGLLRGDLTGDGIDDLVLLRSAQAFGNDAGRSRLRILAGDGSGGYSDATGGIPDISTTEDWHARDAVLINVDGDDDLDIVLITDDLIDSGNRSSLRLLINDGDGNFTDATADSMPDATTAGDHNQGIALIAADVDGQNGPDLVILHTASFQETINESPPLPDPPPEPLPDPVFVTYYYPGTRVLLNDGAGVFTRDAGALPAVDADSLQRFEGDALAAGDIDGADGIDLILTSDDVAEDPNSPGTYLRRAVLLQNDGGGTFTDASSTWLPTGSGAEYLQGDRIAFVDFDASGDLDLVICSDTRLVTPGTSTRPEVSALRIFENDGGAFTDVSADILPGLDGEDALQCHGVAFGDISGDGRPDIFLVSAQAPNIGEHGARVLVWVDDHFARGSEGLPNVLLSDDGRGRAVILHDTDDDDDLDAVIVRDESNQSVRNTRVFRNPRLE